MCASLFSLGTHGDFSPLEDRTTVGFLQCDSSAGETLEKSFALGELWDQTTMELIGRDARILLVQPQMGPALTVDKKSFRRGMKRRKRLGLEFEEEGGHRGGERVQSRGGEGTRGSCPSQDPAPPG